jgi:predicted dehydrogenase
VSWQEEWKVFAEAIKTGKAPIGDGRDGVKALRVVFAAYEAAHRGERISLSCELAETVG